MDIVNYPNVCVTKSIALDIHVPNFQQYRLISAWKQLYQFHFFHQVEVLHVHTTLNDVAFQLDGYSVLDRYHNHIGEQVL